jgi:SAM-dependent methyltransferase
MHAELLDILVEPTTLAPLRLTATRSEGDHVIEGRLTSSATGKIFPIVRGIPRFVEGATYTDSFGLQWNHFREVQVDSNTGRTHSQDRFDAETGWTREHLEGKRLLDVGCGAGRFAEIAASRGPRMVALDFSSAVEAASQTLARYPHADVVQASLFELPFRPGTFDFTYCIGVAQHTPSPPTAVAKVVQAVRAGGRFSMSIYARKPWTRLNGKYLIRPLTRRLPKKLLLRAIELAMPGIFPITDFLYRLPYIGRAARFAMPVATYVDRDDWTREQRLNEAILDTFDMLSPAYDSPMTWQEVEQILVREGARSWEFRTRVPINVVGER